MVLSGCAAGGESSGESAGDGLPVGATIDEYHAAFADIDPIELRAQVPAAQGTDSALKFEAYYDAVTEWSDGKITFDIAWSNAIAPPAESDDALADGRLDIALVIPLTEPARYPANNALASVSFAGQQTLVTGTLQRQGWMTDVFYGTPEITEELEDAGVTPLLPMVLAGPEALICGEELDDFKDVQITAGSPAHAAQIASFGGIPVSLSFAELYEGLERGVVECASNNLMYANSTGLIPIAPNISIGSDVGFGLTPATLAVGTAKWDSLPLVAQQLLFDRTDVYIQRMIEILWSGNKSAITAIEESGGSLSGFTPEVEAGLKKANAGLMDGIEAAAGVDGPALVERIDGALDKWLAVVEDLGYSDEVEYDEWAQWYEPDKIDLTDYMDTLTSELFLEHRPS